MLLLLLALTKMGIDSKTASVEGVTIGTNVPPLRALPLLMEPLLLLLSAGGQSKS